MSRTRRILFPLLALVGILFSAVPAARAQNELLPQQCFGNTVLPWGFQAWQDQRDWMGIAVAPNPLLNDVYLEIMQGESWTDTTAYSPRVVSTQSVAVNFLVKDFSTVEDQWVFVKTWTDPPQNLGYVMDWDPGQGALLIDEEHTYDYGGITYECGLIRVFKVALNAGQQYHFNLIRDEAGDDVRMALLWSSDLPDGWVARSDALFEKLADTPGAATPTTFTASNTGNYALVVFVNDVGASGGEYTVSFEEYDPPVNTPDLLVDWIGPGSATYGSSVTAEIHLKNQGTAASSACVTQVSLDGSVTCAGIATPAIGAGDWATINCSLGTPAVGSHTISVTVDSDDTVAEADEDNNTSSSSLSILAPGAADLIVTEVSPSTTVPNHSFVVSVSVQNIGASSAPASTTLYWTDSGAVSLHLATPALGPGDTVKLNGTVSGLSEGSHGIVVLADYDDQVSESDENNNRYEFNLVAEGPNLVIDSITPTTVYGDGEPNFQITIRNTGTVDSGSSHTGLWVDGDVECGAISTAPVPAGGTLTVVCPGTSLEPGDHTVMAQADVTSAVAENDESDNSLAVAVEMVPTATVVYADGSGYYATIQEAVDAMPSGSQVMLVGGEVYSGVGNRDIDFHGKNLTVVGAFGGGAIIDCGGNPEETHRAFYFHSGEGLTAVVSRIVITNGWNEYGAGGGIFIGDAQPTIELCVIHHCHADVGGAIAFSTDNDLYHAMINGCTFTKNSADLGEAVYLSRNSAPQFRRSLIASNYGSTGAYYGDTNLGEPHPSFSCTDIWGNGGGDWVNGIELLLGTSGNISSDPLFCDFSNDDYTLASNSPCASEVNESCGQIGVYGAQCGPMGGTIRSVKADGTGAYPTIQSAIDDCVDGDIVELADGTYTGTGNYEIDTQGLRIVIRSASGDPLACRIDGQETHQLFRFVNGETPETTVQGIGVFSGLASSGAGIYCEAASPTLLNLYIADNNATGDGGGLYCTDHASPVVQDCIFENNAGYDDAGGIYAYDWSSPKIHGCKFIGNLATNRGGGALFVVNSFPELDGCTFQGNEAANGGGVDFVYAYGPVTNCVFWSNSADYGGAVQCYGNAHSDFTNCTMYDNASAHGAGVYMRSNASPTFASCILSAGRNGAAVDRYADDCNPVFSCSDIHGNALGDWTTFISDQLGVDGNFSADPLFCDRANGNLTLRGDSPCAAVNNVECGQVGALGVACTGSWLVRADGSGDFATIQEAIDAAVDGESVVLADGSYTGDGNRDLDFKGKEITVRSQSGNASDCIIDCKASSSDAHKAFYFIHGETANSVLENVTIRNAWGTYGGGMRIDSSSPTIRGVIFQWNGGGDGGAIILAGASPVIEDCVFEDNEVSDAGGAIYANASAPQIVGCVFKGNSAYWGGGALYNQSSTSSLTDCRFENNSSDHWGGAVHNRYSESAPTFDDCVFVGNTGATGGAVYGRDASHPVFTACTFSGNSSPSGAAAYLASSAEIDWTRSILVFASSGSAVTGDGTGVVHISCSDVYGNAGGDWVNDLDGLLSGSDNFSANPSFCDRYGGDYNLASNSPCLAQHSPCGSQVGAFDLGCVLTDVPETPQAVVSELVLEAAVPNPFNPRTTIAFSLPQGGPVDVVIYSASGRRVTVLVHEEMGAGRHEVVWNGTDDRGREVASGVYLVQVRAKGQAKVRKLGLVR